MIQERTIRIYLGTVRTKKLTPQNKSRGEYALIINKDYLEKFRQRGFNPGTDRVLVYYVEIDGRPGLLIVLP